MRFFGWLILLPFIFLFTLVKFVAESCAEKGGLWRLLGFLFALVISGFIIYVGYITGFEGYTELRDGAYYQVTMPVLGWILIIGGGITAITGVFKSLFGQGWY
jgi:divalent metal cation (Fe/Co/Zn/Cd) transporter